MEQSNIGTKKGFAFKLHQKIRECEIMVKLQSAEEMKQVSTENYEVFQKECIESPTFKRMVQTIEQAALDGQIKVVFKFYEDDDYSMMVVFLNLLRNAGYKVDVLLGNKLAIKWH